MKHTKAERERAGRGGRQYRREAGWNRNHFDIHVSWDDDPLFIPRPRHRHEAMLARSGKLVK